MSQQDQLHVSVLVPIYNMERYLRQCLDSLAAQTIREAEFICLDDGSTDSSPQIVEEYAARDERFVVVHKQNSGYGATMNEGLRRARGTYIGILESDDWVEADCFEELYSLAAKNGFCDIVKANYYQFDEEGERFIENQPEEMCGFPFSFEGPQSQTLIMAVPAIWSALYRREMVEENGISFLETPGASYQDTGFVFKNWICAQTVILDYRGFIHYRTGHSGSSSAATDKVFCVCDEFASIDEFLRIHPVVSESIEQALAAKRFITYRWNLARVGTDEKLAFIMRASKELRVCGETIGWDRSLFSDAQWNELQKWITDPKGLNLDKRIAEAQKQSQLRALPLRFLRKIRTMVVPQKPAAR